METRYRKKTYSDLLLLVYCVCMYMKFVQILYTVNTTIESSILISSLLVCLGFYVNFYVKPLYTIL